MKLNPKKKFGQHFLINNEIAKKIVEHLSCNHSNKIIEIGPGSGALTKFLIKKKAIIKLIEIDYEAIPILKKKFPDIEIIHADFLNFELNSINWQKYSVLGNFPYNISSQILFKILENRDSVIELVGMFQKEFADRICSKPKSKKYGIPSVLLQAFFDCEHLFDVGPLNFFPKPKVDSSVIRLTRNNISNLGCDYLKFVETVKISFSQRRKKIKNSLKKISKFNNLNLDQNLISKRAEELSVLDFVKLTKSIFPKSK